MSEIDKLIAQLSPEVREALQTAEQNGHRAVREPLVYQRHGSRSYFADRALAASDLPTAAAAGARLERHRRQMEAIPDGEARTLEGTNHEYRVNPNLEKGHGLEFTVPLWLNQYFATARRPGEVIQRLVRENGNEFELPQGCSSIAVPRITTGTVANEQTPNAPNDNQDVETAEVKAQAIIYTGESDWSLQALEQSPQGAHLDWVVFKDLGESLDAELEADFIAGRGESFNEALGLLEISGTNSVTYTSAAPTGPMLYAQIGKALAQSGSKRRLPPTEVLMTSNRFFWLGSSEDSSNRPLFLEDYPDQDFPLSGLCAIGIYPDDAISQTLGANKEQDAIFATRSNDFLLWHSSIRTAVMEEPLAGTLGVRFLLYRTTATMLHRYPAGISKITGTGLKVQAEYS